MEEIKIRLTTAEEVREFVRAARKCEFDVDISYGRAVVDGKSIMGIFSLDLSKPIDLNIHADGNVDEILTALDAYIIK